MTLRNYIIIAALGSVLAVRAQEEPAAPVFLLLIFRLF